MIHVKEEALRYLGYRGSAPDETTAALLDNGFEELSAAAAGRHVYKIAEKSEISGLLVGNDINEHLSGSDRAVIFAATLGSGADSVIRRAEIGNMAYALILDALASAMIEEYCDNTEAEINSAVGGNFTWRFSPGYGDYPIEMQPDIIRYLNAEKLIGLTVTASNILLPRKSVTAVIGVSDNAQLSSKNGCDTCNMRESCQFRKTGTSCRGGTPQT